MRNPGSRAKKALSASRALTLAAPAATLALLRLPWAKNQATPPGSLGLPFLGETLAYSKDPHRFFEERVARHGNVFKTRLLGKNIIAFTGPEAFTFFADNPHFDRQGGSPPHVDKLLCRESLPLIDGPKHQQMRKLVLQSFTVEAIQTYLPVVQRITEEYAERWAGLGSFAWVDEYKKLSASICAALLLGAEAKAHNNDNLVPVLDRLLAGVSTIPIDLPFTTYGKALRSRDALLSLIDDAIRNREHLATPGILARMVDARDENGTGLASEQLRAQMLHMFFAAYGGIFRVHSLLSMVLAQYEDVLEHARGEVRSVTPSGDIGLSELMRLPYLEEVTFEVRRNNRIFASTFFDRVTSDLDYGGYEIPSGWRVTGGIYTTMQDSSVFTRPATFDPDRFGPERAEQNKKENSYVPQGGGPEMGHRCPAEDLTTHIMKLVGSVLLRSYSWELLPQDLTLDRESSPMPKDRIRVRFQRVGG